MGCNHLSDCPRCGDEVEGLEAEVEQWKASFARIERLRRKAVQKTKRKHDEIKRLRKGLLAFIAIDERLSHNGDTAAKGRALGMKVLLDGFRSTFDAGKGE
jgi:hypothetical protein